MSPNVKTERTLRVSDTLELPLALVTHRNAILAVPGAGKSNAAVVLAEEMHRCDVPWCAFDWKGDWHGMRSSRDGKGPGLPIPIFGGDHGDLPLPATSGTRMGELVAAGKLHGIFDLSNLAHDPQLVARFMIDFADAAMAHQATPIHFFLDEADEYLPQPGTGGRLEGLLSHCVKAWKRVALKGRQKGIGFTLITQRPANVSKSALYACETLIAMRTSGKRDKTAIGEFVEAHGQADELVKSLPSLEDGEAWIWSPVRLRMMQRVRFRRRATFDSGRTPEIAEAIVAPELAELDLEGLRKELVELEPSDEPAPATPRGNRLVEQLGELRGRNAELERELAEAHAAAARPSLTEDDRTALTVLTGKTEALAELARGTWNAGLELLDLSRGFQRTLERMVGERAPLPEGVELGPPEVGVQTSTKPAHENSRPAAQGSSSGLGRCAREILTALHQHGELSLVQAAIIAGYASDSGGVRNAAGELRAGAFVTGSNARLAITDRGRGEVRNAPRLPTGRKLAEYWYGKLARAEALILSAVLERYPAKVSLAQAAKAAGYEPSSGGVRNAAGKLRTLNLVHGSNAGMTADARLV